MENELRYGIRVCKDKDYPIFNLLEHEGKVLYKDFKVGELYAIYDYTDEPFEERVFPTNIIRVDGVPRFNNDITGYIFDATYLYTKGVLKDEFK